MLLLFAFLLVCYDLIVKLQSCMLTVLFVNSSILFLKEKSLHRTEGIDIFVTSERLILLDSQVGMLRNVSRFFLKIA